MKKFHSFILILCVSFIASACAIEPMSKLRSIVLNGEQYSENVPGDFVSIFCRDYLDRFGPIRVEVGTFSGPESDRVGFVLYDGSSHGTRATYRREGLDHRWDWESDGDNFSFTIEPDGTGRYFDFRFADEDGVAKSRQVYSCW